MHLAVLGLKTAEVPVTEIWNTGGLKVWRPAKNVSLTQKECTVHNDQTETVKRVFFLLLFVSLANVHI